jgi:putative Mn2+ efflux pump MntP
MVTVLLYVFVIFGIGLFLMTYIGRNSNPLVPQYLLTEPFYLYTTLLIGIGISIPFLILKLIKK